MSAGRFAWERAVRDDLDGDGQPVFVKADLAILLTLATWANRDLEVWPSQATVAKAAGYSVGQVRRSIARARDLGYLQLVERGGRAGDGSTRSSINRLTLPQARTDARLSTGSTAHPRRLNRAEPPSEARTHAPRTDHTNRPVDEHRADGDSIHRPEDEAEQRIAEVSKRWAS